MHTTATANPRRELRPQPGPQTAFLESRADIAIYGGAAGGGKTWALLAEPLRHVRTPGFECVLFRRTQPELKKPGGMWRASMKLYPDVGAVPNITELLWTFPHSGATVKLSQMQHDKDRLAWGGSEIALIGFDQLETFEGDQFWFMLSRNRSTCGVIPYIRATANPQPGWLADLLSWWIDQNSGYPIPERAGVLRWFVRVNGQVIWADSPGELPTPADAKSITFIPAKVTDNAILMALDPGYEANLKALPHVERERLLGGNWKIYAEGSEWPPEYFPESMWFTDWPRDLQMRITALDPSTGTDKKKGDYSAIVNMGRCERGHLWWEADLARRPIPRMIEDLIANHRIFRAHAVGVEINGFQQLLAPDIERQSLATGVMLPVNGIKNYGVSKPERIRRLSSYLAAGVCHFRDTPGTRLLVDQLKMFGFPNVHDDGPDAMEMALRLGIDMSYNDE